MQLSSGIAVNLIICYAGCRVGFLRFPWRGGVLDPPESLYIKDRFSAILPPSQMEKLSIGGKFSENSTFLGGV